MGEDVGPPVGRGVGIEGTGIGSNGSGRPSEGHGGGEDEVIVILRVSQTEEGRPGALFKGGGVGTGVMKATGLVHDRVESVGGGQGKVAVETSEGNVALVGKWGETQVNAKELDGDRRDAE